MTDLGVAEKNRHSRVQQQHHSVTVLLGQPKNKRELPQIQEGRTQKNRKNLDEIVTEVFASQSLAMHGYSQQVQLSVEKHPGYFFDFLRQVCKACFRMGHGAWRVVDGERLPDFHANRLPDFHARIASAPYPPPPIDFHARTAASHIHHLPDFHVSTASQIFMLRYSC